MGSKPSSFFSVASSFRSVELVGAQAQIAHASISGVCEGGDHHEGPRPLADGLVEAAGAVCLAVEVTPEDHAHRRLLVVREQEQCRSVHLREAPVRSQPTVASPAEGLVQIEERIALYAYPDPERVQHLLLEPIDLLDQQSVGEAREASRVRPALGGDPEPHQLVDSATQSSPTALQNSPGCR